MIVKIRKLGKTLGKLIAIFSHFHPLCFPYNLAFELQEEPDSTAATNTLSQSFSEDLLTENTILSNDIKMKSCLSNDDSFYSQNNMKFTDTIPSAPPIPEDWHEDLDYSRYLRIR